MKIAITGANGFVGSNLCKHFLQQGHEVFALIRFNAGNQLLPQGVNTFSVNYQSPGSLQNALLGMDVLIHNAGRTRAINSRQMLQANLELTGKVVAAVNASASSLQLIYISSQAASHPSYGGIPAKESEPGAPLTIYGKSKLAAEKAIQNTCLKPWTIIRPCSIYGGGDRDFLNLFKTVQQGISFQIGRQDKLLNMIHIDELAAFIQLCLQNPVVFGEVLFATDSVVYKQSDILAAIALALQKTPRHIVIPELLARAIFALGDLSGRLRRKQGLINREKMKEIMAEGWLADTTKAVDLLNWKPLPNLQQHILETAKCYIELGWL